MHEPHVFIKSYFLIETTDGVFNNNIRFGYYCTTIMINLKYMLKMEASDPKISNQTLNVSKVAVCRRDCIRYINLIVTSSSVKCLLDLFRKLFNLKDLNL